MDISSSKLSGLRQGRPGVDGQEFVSSEVQPELLQYLLFFRGGESLNHHYLFPTSSPVDHMLAMWLEAYKMQLCHTEQYGGLCEQLTAA